MGSIWVCHSHVKGQKRGKLHGTAGKFLYFPTDTHEIIRPSLLCLRSPRAAHSSSGSQADYSTEENSCGQQEGLILYCIVAKAYMLKMQSVLPTEASSTTRLRLCSVFHTKFSLLGQTQRLPARPMGKVQGLQRVQGWATSMCNILHYSK